jgi:hypothetical protein
VNEFRRAFQEPLTGWHGLSNPRPGFGARGDRILKIKFPQKLSEAQKVLIRAAVFLPGEKEHCGDVNEFRHAFQDPLTGSQTGMFQAWSWLWDAEALPAWVSEFSQCKGHLFATHLFEFPCTFRHGTRQVDGQCGLNLGMLCVI